MKIVFVHLSDIHFGQEKGSEVFYYDDVKEQLIHDAASVVSKKFGGSATGIIVTGDIAYAGKREEYQRAGEWLDKLAKAVGCKKTAVQVVPGNHDIDRKAISSGCQMMLDAILLKGQAKLDEFLKSDLDREVLYHRFSGYRPFAEGYDCPLDKAGGYASERTFDLAPGRTLRFIGLNSALICSSADQEGNLLLGVRQLVLPRQPGEELVVLGHHPLNWLKDSTEARRYIRSRARVFISGHEHNPAVNIEEVKPGCDLMMLAAGATVPPFTEKGYSYTYNLIAFEWHAESDGLAVTIAPRTWSAEDTAFAADHAPLQGRDNTNVLACPNFRNLGDQSQTTKAKNVETLLPDEEHGARVENHDGVRQMPDAFPLLLLKYFRDLSPGQRLAVLAKLRALPDDWAEPLSHAMERHVIDALASSGRLSELEEAIREIQAQRRDESGEKE